MNDQPHDIELAELRREEYRRDRERGMFDETPDYCEEE
jgi:hypothetical protein